MDKVRTPSNSVCFLLRITDTMTSQILTFPPGTPCIGLCSVNGQASTPEFLPIRPKALKLQFFYPGASIPCEGEQCSVPSNSQIMKV
jgi:hypothetical protein